MTMEIHNSDLELIKNRVYFFIKSNPGYGVDQISKGIKVPLNVIHKAVGDLLASGHLKNDRGLRIGRRLGE